MVIFFYSRRILIKGKNYFEKITNIEIVNAIFLCNSVFALLENGEIEIFEIMFDET